MNSSCQFYFLQPWMAVSHQETECVPGKGAQTQGVLLSLACACTSSGHCCTFMSFPQYRNWAWRFTGSWVIPLAFLKIGVKLFLRYWDRSDEQVTHCSLASSSFSWYTSLSSEPNQIPVMSNALFRAFHCTSLTSLTPLWGSSLASYPASKGSCLGTTPRSHAEMQRIHVAFPL